MNGLPKFLNRGSNYSFSKTRNKVITKNIYSANYLEIEYDENDTTDTLDVQIDGGLIGRQMIIRREEAEPMNVTITHNASLISRILNTQFNTTSPLVDIGHWEEEY